MKQYRATVAREGKWWMVRVPEISGLTQARRLSEAALMAREMIAATTDTSIDEIDVVISVQAIGPIDSLPERLARIAKVREHAAELDRSATRASAVLAKELSALDIPLRDVGTVLGVSHQRAHQLVHGR